MKISYRAGTSRYLGPAFLKRFWKDLSFWIGGVCIAMRSMRENCIWKYFFWEIKFSHLHFVSLLWAWVRIPPTTEFLFQNWTELFFWVYYIFLDFTKFLHLKNVAHQILSNSDNWEMKMIGIIWAKLLNFILNYICRNNRKRKKFSSVGIWSQDLWRWSSPLFLLSYLGKKKNWKKIHKVLEFKSFIR